MAMGVLEAILVTGLAAEVTAAVDLSAWDPAASDYPVARLGAALCLGHPDGHALATAIVTYGRRPGRSAWGHTSLRFLACEGQQLVDVELEYYRLDASIERWFALNYTDEAWAHDDAFLGEMHGKLVLVRNDRPVDGGFYAAEIHKNREVVEAWMPWEPEVQRVVYRTFTDRHARQIDTLRRGAPLDGHDYAPMGTNCTLHVREALGIAGGHSGEWVGSVFPIANLRMLEDTPGVDFVLHPSPSAMRRLAGREEVAVDTRRIPTHIWRRGLAKRKRTVVEDSLPDAVPVIVRRLLESSDATADLP